MARKHRKKINLITYFFSSKNYSRKSVKYKNNYQHQFSINFIRKNCECQYIYILRYNSNNTESSFFLVFPARVGPSNCREINLTNIVRLFLNLFQAPFHKTSKHKRNYKKLVTRKMKKNIFLNRNKKLEFYTFSETELSIPHDVIS